MNSHNFFEITIPRSDHLDEYHALLKTKIFPAIDELLAKKLINTYHFLTHAGLDLRISVYYFQDLPKVAQVLSCHDLPNDFRVWDEKHERLEQEDEVLRLNSEIVRVLLDHPDRQKFYYLVLHYQNNSYGMDNHDEVEFHFEQMIAWSRTIKIVNQKKDRYTAQMEAIDEIMIKLTELKNKIPVLQK